LTAHPLFYLGTHKPHWLWGPEPGFPLFVSHRTLSKYKALHRATGRWALDSGGFSELSAYGTWLTGPDEYVRAVARYAHEIGNMDWAAPQDWMCEPAIIHGGMVNGKHFPGTGLSVPEHQERTVANFLELTGLWPAVSDLPCPFIPVLQGWTEADYLRCEDMYRASGTDLTAFPVAGVGSVCRRQGTGEIGDIIGALTPRLSIHAFGVKTLGLRSYGHLLTSADSMAWSYDARRNAPMAGHVHQHCNNCLPYATQWRSRLLSSLNYQTLKGGE
jgi:hypothetical protein